MSKKRDNLRNRLNVVLAERRKAEARYDLARDMDVGVANGHFVAYLFDSTHLMDDLFEVVRMERISRKAYTKFIVAEKMLLQSYQRSHRALEDKMLAYVESEIRRMS